MRAALRIRKWGAWGTLATLAALCLLALLALALAARPRIDTGGAGRRTAVLLVRSVLGVHARAGGAGGWQAGGRLRWGPEPTLPRYQRFRGA